MFVNVSLLTNRNPVGLQCREVVGLCELKLHFAVLGTNIMQLTGRLKILFMKELKLA